MKTKKRSPTIITDIFYTHNLIQQDTNRQQCSFKEKKNKETPKLPNNLKHGKTFIETLCFQIL